MAKAGMKRPDPKRPIRTENDVRPNYPKNSLSPVPELSGKVKSGKRRARPK